MPIVEGLNYLLDRTLSREVAYIWWVNAIMQLLELASSLVALDCKCDSWFVHSSYVWFVPVYAVCTYTCMYDPLCLCVPVCVRAGACVCACVCVCVCVCLGVGLVVTQ